MDNARKENGIKKQGLVQEVNIRCKGDEKREKIELRISPRVKLDFEGAKEEGYEVGDWLYEADDGKFVYLGYIGTKEDTGKIEDLFLYFAKMPKQYKEGLGESELSSANILVKQLIYSKMTGVGVVDFTGNVLKAYAGIANLIFQYIKEGKSFYRLNYNYQEDIYGKQVSIIGFAGAQDKWDVEKLDEFNCVSSSEEFDASKCNVLDMVCLVDVPEFRRFEESPCVWIVKTKENQWKNTLELNENVKFSDKWVNDFYATDSVTNLNTSGQKYTKDEFEKKIRELIDIEDEKSETLEKQKEYYKKAMNDYDKVINSFSSEEFQDGMNKITYGEEALYQKIILAWNTEQKKTLVELCEEFKEKYPNSKKSLRTQCDDAYKLSSSEIVSNDISINGIVKRISLRGIYEPSFEDYSAEIKVRDPDGKMLPSLILRKDQIVYLDEEENNFIQLIELRDDYAFVNINLKPESTLEEIKKATISSSRKKLKEDVPESFGSGYVFTLTKINLKKSAKVSVIPNINNAGTEVNFSFKIGIEQRAIELSPEKTRKKIAQLNKTIAEWEEKSEQLGKVVKGLKTACLGVGAYVTIKNLWINKGGKAIARQEVMKEIWYPRCSDDDFLKQNNYKTVNECLTKQSKNIDNDVDAYYKILEAKNKEFEDLQEGITTTNWMGEKTINDKELAKKVFTDDRREKLIETFGKSGIKEIEIDGEKKPVEEIVSMINENTFSITSFRDLEVMATASGFSSLKEMADKQIKKELTDIYRTNRERVERQTLAEKYGVSEVDYGSTKEKMQEFFITKDVTWSNVKSQFSNVPEGVDDKTYIRFYGDSGTGSKEYLVTLNNDYHVTKTYEINLIDGKYSLESYSKEGDDNPFNLEYEKRDSSTYENQYKSSLGESHACLRYYETEPYKGLPAVVPFDLKNGWYAWVGQTLPVFGGIKSYEESGRVTSFWVCNVGENGIEENKAGDDICQMINTGTGQAYDVFHGLDSGKASGIIRDAREAVEQASKVKTRTAGQVVRINRQSVRICKPAVDVPEMQCQSFMSPKDCQLLFNVCDPVICPSSRCNFGGTYYVKDVIQSGIIGSIALCLPNIREGIYIPVCLTGIKAGIDGLLSVYTSYRDCLQESLDTGKMIGICDEIYSIHLCEFFWRQSLPLAKMVIPKIMEVALGQNVRGGGEYLGVASAWANAEKSVDYFAQYYAVDSYEAFKGRIVEGIGDAVCKNSISGVYPDGGNLLNSLTEPDSPPQFHGRFDEIEFTTATNPPISHYKVFYHIYAGKESRAYYKVYLKSPPGTSFYQDTPIRYIASGYIATGGYATETKDFTAPSGYKELCIMVNNQEECGFKQVSTSYAVNYVNDKYMEEQTSERDIKSEKECIGGSVSAYSLLSPSLEGAADEMINPAIYNRGIIRICATESPGMGTDGKYGTEDERWIQVGNCGSENIKCWLDRESVKDVIKHTDIEDKVLEEHSKSQLEILRSEGNYFEPGVFSSLVKKIKELIEKGKRESFKEAVEKLDEDVMKKAFLNKEKSELLLLRGNAYSGLAGERVKVEVKESLTTTEDGEIEKESESEEEGVSEEEIEEDGEDETEIKSKIQNVLFEQDKEKVILIVKHNCEQVKYEIVKDGFWFFNKNMEEGIIVTQIEEFDINTFENLDNEKVFEIGEEYYAKAYCLQENKVVDDVKSLTIKMP